MRHGVCLCSPQPVPQLDVSFATQDLERLAFEVPSPFEAFGGLAVAGVVADIEPPVTDGRRGVP